MFILSGLIVRWRPTGRPGCAGVALTTPAQTTH